MRSVLLALVLLCAFSTQSTAFFFGVGSAPDLRGVTAPKAMFDPAKGVDLLGDGRLVLEMQSSLQPYVSGDPYIVENSPNLLRSFFLRSETSPGGVTLRKVSKQGAPAVHPYQDKRGGGAFDGRAVSFHRYGDTPGYYIAQFAPSKADGSYTYTLARAFRDDRNSGFRFVSVQLSFFFRDYEAMATAQKAAGISDTTGRSLKANTSAQVLAILDEIVRQDSQIGIFTRRGFERSAGREVFMVAREKSETLEKIMVAQAMASMCTQLAGVTTDPNLPKSYYAWPWDAINTTLARPVCEAAPLGFKQQPSALIAAWRVAAKRIQQGDTSARALKRVEGLEAEMARRDMDWAVLAYSSRLSNGIGVARNVKGAEALLRQEAQSGNNFARFGLGLNLYLGVFGPNRADEGEPFLQAAAKDIPHASYWLGRYWSRSQAQDAEARMVKAYQDGRRGRDPFARLALAELHISGQGVEKNRELANKALQGLGSLTRLHRAQYLQGFFKLHGQGTRQSTALARNHFESAVALGSQSAKSELAGIYLTNSTAKDDVLGLKLLREAEAAGLADAKRKLSDPRIAAKIKELEAQ
ncbi:MAG: hypothetical protein AAGD04_16330 [Pseudomonadota bacterium]